MKRAALFAVGYEELAVSREDAAAVAEICRREGYICRRARFEGDKYIFRCTLITARSLIRRCGAAGIDTEVLRRAGLPRLVYRYRHRYGIALGVLLFFAILFFSGRVIWDVRVEGNRRLSEEEVIASLRDCGLSVGDFKRQVDTSLIENLLMIESEDVSWISINLIGTVAEVEIREREFAEESEPWAASNVVAAEEGDILLFEDVRGNILLKIGDRVEAGDLIISGIYEGVGGIRYTCAKGKVLALTEEEIEIKVPFEYDKKGYTGEVYTEKYLVFFEKEIKIYSNCRNLDTTCDKIDTVEYADVCGGGELPVGVRTVRYYEYTYERQTRDQSEAERLAEYKLSTEIYARASNSEVVGITTRYLIEEDGVRVVCRLRSIKDIAKRQEIEINITP